jgi:Ni/Fe-hydrogenase 1 B-type cytochrome subunit
MAVLVLSGLYLFWPYIPGVMSVARGAHIICGVFICINAIVRAILSFFVKSSLFSGTREVDKDYKNFIPQKANKGQFIPWIKYYLFIKKEMPLGSKYTPPQKLSYLSIPFVICFMAFTGLCLWTPTANWGVCAWFIGLVDGQENIRLMHFFFMWILLYFIAIHVYLATIEGPGLAKMMFLQRETGGYIYDPKSGHIVGEDFLDGTPPLLDPEYAKAKEKEKPPKKKRKVT